MHSIVHHRAWAGLQNHLCRRQKRAGYGVSDRRDQSANRHTRLTCTTIDTAEHAPARIQRMSELPSVVLRLSACLAIVIAAVGMGRSVPATEHRTIPDIPYRAADDGSDQGPERCRLDLHVPMNVPDFATVIWFHGGGLTKGDREIPKPLRDRGFAVVGAGYRLSPAVKATTCIEDAAAAVAWTFRSISKHGGSPHRIYVSGHSAGGYLASMIGLDRRWLASHGIDADHLAGIVPYSGQCITHFTIRAERGIPERQPLVDEFAPLFHVRPSAPPLLLITGDRDREMLGRYEENAYLWRMMKVAGHRDTRIEEIAGCDHGSMVAPGHHLLVEFVTGKAATQPVPLPQQPAAARTPAAVQQPGVIR